jgi:putative flavoprotein involved in K+ transport
VARRISPRVTQLHSHDYRGERALAPGAVLIVGSGQTGLQLAAELTAAGRQVYVAVGSAGRVRDIFSWLIDLLRHGADQLPDPRRRYNAMPALSGHCGGHDTNLRAYALQGMRLAGYLAGADGEHPTFADDLERSLQAADDFFDARSRPVIDAYIARPELDAPHLVEQSLTLRS